MVSQNDAIGRWSELIPVAIVPGAQVGDWDDFVADVVLQCVNECLGVIHHGHPCIACQWRHVPIIQHAYDVSSFVEFVLIDVVIGQEDAWFWSGLCWRFRWLGLYCALIRIQIRDRTGIRVPLFSGWAFLFSGVGNRFERVAVSLDAHACPAYPFDDGPGHPHLVVQLM